MQLRDFARRWFNNFIQKIINDQNIKYGIYNVGSGSQFQ